jgi:hypothetical protein
MCATINQCVNVVSAREQSLNVSLPLSGSLLVTERRLKPVDPERTPSRCCAFRQESFKQSKLPQPGLLQLFTKLHYSSVPGYWLPGVGSSETKVHEPELETLSLACSRRSWPKHTKSFNLIDTLSVGVDRIQRNFEPLQRQVELWRKTQIPTIPQA